MHQIGFFDLENRYEQLSRCGDPLEQLNAVIDWKVFLPLLQKAFSRARKSEAGRKPYDRLLMFKLLVLQSLYNLSDYQVEYQVRDRLSFMRFLELLLGAKVPDEKTLWSFREVLVQGRVVEKLFNKFNAYLEKQGFEAKLGSIVDASIVEVPKQRNTKEENQQIKEGQTPEAWKESSNQLRQKDVEARWTQKNNQNFYGYKNHVNVDVQHKMIRKFKVTAASQGDITCLPELLDEKNLDKKIWGDKAYRSDAIETLLKEKNYVSRIHYKPRQGKWISEKHKRWNYRYSKIRARVEHVFGFISNSMKGNYLRGIGLARIGFKVGLNNLVYNICRYKYCLQGRSA